MSTGLAVALLAPGAIGLWFSATRARARDAAAPPAMLMACGRKLAVALAALQLACAIISFGSAAGPALVLSAWMIAGSLFVPWVNYRPAVALRVSVACAGAGAVLALAHGWAAIGF